MDSLHVWVSRKEADAAEDVLWQLGVVGIETRELESGELELVSGPADGETADDANDARDPERFWRGVAAAVTGRWCWERRAFDQSAAEHAWRPYATLSTIGDVIIRPVWIASPGGDSVVVDVEPGDGWGHGGHPSTVLAGELVQRTLDGSTPIRVLDVGCGSGVLSLLAAQRGASVVAVDLDPSAVAATAANAARNGWSDRIVALTVEAFDAGPLATAGFGLVAANLGIWVLDEVDTWLAARVEPGGRLVLSGLLIDQIERVCERPVWDGWGKIDLHQDEPWAAVALHRPGLLGSRQSDDLGR